MGEIVSVGNELGAKSEGVVATPAVWSRVVTAQLVPVAPDLEWLRRALSWCSVPAPSAVPGCAIPGQPRPCVLSSLTHRGISNSIRWLWFPKQAD